MSERRRAVPIPEARTQWAGLTKDRLVAKPTIEASPEIDRLVNRAVARAKTGDSEAVRYLYLRYADNVYGYVRAIVHDHHDAEDATQQVFTKLLAGIVTYEQRSVPFVAWLLRLAHNVAIDAVRARRTTPAGVIFGSDNDVHEDAPDHACALKAAFAALPELQREVVVLRHVLGLSPDEIAERLGRTSSSVHGLHHRGRRALRTELERRDTTPLTARAPMAIAA